MQRITKAQKFVTWRYGQSEKSNSFLLIDIIIINVYVMIVGRDGEKKPTVEHWGRNVKPVTVPDLSLFLSCARSRARAA